jgi:hypothetical protein
MFGALLKHCCAKIDNKYIPVFLIGAGIVVALVMHYPFDVKEYLLTYLIEGFASGFAATIVHQKGKDIFSALLNGTSDTLIKDTLEEYMNEQSDAEEDLEEEDEEIASEFDEEDNAAVEETSESTDEAKEASEDATEETENNE